MLGARSTLLSHNKKEILSLADTPMSQILRKDPYLKLRLQRVLMLRALRVITGLLILALQHAAIAAALDPDDFTSLGTLSLTSGDYTFDTTAMTIVENSAPGTVLFTGVEDDQNGQADSFAGGSDTVGVNGIPHIAVFTFDDISIDGTNSITITGNRAIALLSKSNLYLDETLSVDAVPAPDPTAPEAQFGGKAGPGGFDGGTTGVNGGDGEGPGGASGFNGIGSVGSSGGFGGNGRAGNGAPAGMSYGDLLQALQGGSGGGDSGTVVTPEDRGPGGGGGGAIMLVASQAITIDSNGVVSARGADGYSRDSVAIPGFVGSPGGGGSGGGIILAGLDVIINGQVVADSLVTTGGLTGGGGRVLVAGYSSFLFGSTPDVNSFIANIDVDPPFGPSIEGGWISVVPRSTLVPLGESLAINNATIQIQDNNEATGVEFIPGNLVATGELTVPAGGTSYAFDISLTGPTGTTLINGSDPLQIQTSLSGSGTVNVPLVIDADAELNMVNDELTFQGDGIANDDGLVNNGTMNLINAIINGDVRSPAGSNINVAGSATFNGLFSGAGTFSGTSNLITFNGGYSPGDSPAVINFGGDVSLSSANTLLMEIFGNVAGSGYDQLTVAGNLAVSGVIDLFVDPLLTLNAGDSFTLLNWSSVAGEFASVLGIQQTNDLDIGIRYNAGNMVAKVVPRGDVNDDGVVNDDDLAIIASNAGVNTSSYFSGDVNGDGVVDNSSNTGSDRSLVEAAILNANTQTVPLPFWLPLILLMGATITYRLSTR